MGPELVRKAEAVCMRTNCFPVRVLAVSFPGTVLKDRNELCARESPLQTNLSPAYFGLLEGHFRKGERKREIPPQC